MDIKEIVLNTLKKSPAPLKSGEIADISGQDKAKVDKAIKNLVSEDKVTSPKRCYYQVK